ncbi:MAG: hypothetical protein WCT05_05150 [Lentisphaeria bacterium]
MIASNGGTASLPKKGILIGNSFPLSLIRRVVLIRPSSQRELREALTGRRVVSFWGHANTLLAASQYAGCDLTPSRERPTVRLSAECYPCFAAEIFRECWVLSPDYVGNFRPGVGEEVPAEKILGWQVLRLEWDAVSGR